ncbi:MAG: PTS sugar transporter subunit IIA [Alkalispirochaeta sp.]
MATFVQRLIDTETIMVGAHASDWEEAVRIGGDLMVQAGLCEQRYIDAIIENHKTIGPYFVIAPGIALPHAKPKNGVLKTGYALVTLDEPVEFGDEDNDPVDILIFAGAVNREEHNQEAIPQIAELCDSETYIEALRAAGTVGAIREVLHAFSLALENGELD